MTAFHLEIAEYRNRKLMTKRKSFTARHGKKWKGDVIMRIYGTVNGRPVYSRDEFVYACRGFGAIENDQDLLAFAEKATHGWYYAGWHSDFRTYYLGDYAESEPLRSLTYTEYARLKELQEKVQKEYDEAEAAREWKHVNTVYYADNSVEEIWRDKNGVEKEVMVVPPHGDVCF